ncbi:MAG TPA: YeeE/YedE thiosulfate transporter family protein [Caldilineaceae bacterium]|nr:YeeE/YedE thiosulfate transporter family protein [Caldilineaceae bacterium]
MIHESTMTFCQGRRNPRLCGTLQAVAAYAPVILVGVIFGIILTKAEVISWYRVHSMFLFQEAHMYLVIISAIVTGALSLWVIRKFNLKTIQGEPVVVKSKPYQKGVIYGGVLFGFGWAITGACPGPIYAQLGAGEWLALLPFVGALLGSYAYALARPRLPH